MGSSKARQPAASPRRAPTPIAADAEIRQRFESALSSFVAKAEQDPYLLAGILFGSLSYDRVWEKSDIDLMLVGTEPPRGMRGKESGRFFTLVEEGINIHASLQSRSDFKKMIEGSLQSSFMHSSFSRSRLLFSKDPTINELYDGANRLGARDQQAQLFRSATWLLPGIYKAEKWFHVKQDLDYSFLYVLQCLTPLAQIEVYLDGQIAGREVIQQALEINPRFFKSVYTDLIHAKKDRKTIAAALESIDGYVLKKVRTLFGPLLEYLDEAGAPRSATEIETHFKNQMNLSGVVTVCEWLSDKGIIEKLSMPCRLTEKSRVQFEEAAFYYEETRRG